ncbi:hypothetical protein B0H14DRAFT_3548089 [Mycena olivaceomarginata]|nr:hypothetical protein B0H14DRAFT_3548089 [Mycena olivaceomarginata]
MDEVLSLRMTDQHEILRGDVSLSHVVSRCNHNHPGGLGNPDGNTIRTMRSKGIRLLADLGFWHRDSSGRLIFKVDWSARRHGRWTDTQKWLFDGPKDLLSSRAERRGWAEANIRQLAVCCALQPSPTVDGAEIWGTDGSMIPASASLNESRHVTAAATGPMTLVVQLKGRNLSILHGELMGHIVALILRRNKGPTPLFYSDHQNSVHLIDDICTRVCEESRLRGMNGRAYYRWILELTREGPAIMTLIITRLARSNLSFTFRTIADGWIESNAQSFVDFFLATSTASKLAIGNRMRMLTWVHDTTPPPDYPYTHALSAHSAVIQLYARSGHLPTAETLESRAKLDSCMCRLGCLAVESMHHIFVDCTLFAEWREEAANELVVRTTAKLAEAGIPGEQQQWIYKQPRYEQTTQRHGR